MKKIIIFSVALVAILFFSSSCSKKSNPAPAPVCKLTGILQLTGAEVDTFKISYGNDGRISTSVESEKNNTITKVFTYIGTVMLISTNNSDGTGSSTDSIVLNSDGNMVLDLNYTGSDKLLTTYTYSGGQLQQIVVKKNDDAAVSNTVTYANGDLVGISNGTVYTYNASKASTIGDYNHLAQLIVYGAPIGETAHQMTGYKVGSTVANLNYAYDNTGKISGVTLTQGSNVTVFDYTYDCN